MPNLHSARILHPVPQGIKILPTWVLYFHGNLKRDESMALGGVLTISSGKQIQCKEDDMEKILFKSEEKKSSLEIATMLRNIADKIEQGHMVLRQDENEVSLDFPDHMTLEIKVEEEIKRTKGTQLKLEIELEWYPGDKGHKTGVTIE